MTIRKIPSAGVHIPLQDFVGEAGILFYDHDTGELRLSDGHTPGGKAVGIPSLVAPATSSTLGGVIIGSGLNIDSSGTVSVSNIESTDLIPKVDSAYNLGSTTSSWNTLYAKNLALTGTGPKRIVSGNDLTLAAAGQVRISNNSGNWTFNESSGLEFPDGSIQYTAPSTAPLDNINMDGGGAATIYGQTTLFADGGTASERFGPNDIVYDGSYGNDYVLNGGGA